MPARDAGAVGVGLLVTGHALQRRNTLALGPAHDIGEMAMSIVALLRMVRGGVAVDATGSGPHGVEPRPRTASPRRLGGRRIPPHRRACRAPGGPLRPRPA